MIRASSTLTTMDLILFGNARENIVQVATDPTTEVSVWRYSAWLTSISGSSQVDELWAHVDLNHGPHPYQGCALTGLSYGPPDW